MTHLTARDFLLNGSTESEFGIDEKLGHSRLLLTCLRYLNSEDESPKGQRSSVNNIPKTHSAFISYASDSVCEHISHVSWTDSGILSSLGLFFKSSNVLSWIEYIAKHSDQQRLVDAGKALGTFLQEDTNSGSPSSKDLVLLRSWATDLVRLVMQFGKQLEAYPFSIYRLIPPFCPSETALRKQFGSGARNITVNGLRAETWDDCLAFVVDNQEQYSSLASSKTLFSIGCFSGKISVLKQATCQQIAVFEHEEPVRLLKFGDFKKVLVSAGSKTIRIWDLVSKTQLRVFDAPQ